MNIKIENKGNLPLFDYRNFQNLQGDLKSMNDEGERKLISSFKKHGFFIPFFIWIDKKSNIWTLDGNGRIKVMIKNDIKNADGEYYFPCWEVMAKSKKEAAEKILIISSEFHEKTKEGLLDFMKTHKINEQWVQTNTAFATSIDMFSAEKPSQDEIDDFFEDKPQSGSGGGTGAEDTKDFKIVLNYTEDDYREVKDRLSKIAHTPEQAVFELLRLNG